MKEMYQKVGNSVPMRKFLEDLGLQVKEVKDRLYGQCPFKKHSGTPVAVTPGKELFYCRDCKKGGNIFTLAASLANCSNKEALERIAKKYKVDLSEFKEKKDSEPNLGNRANFF